MTSKVNICNLALSNIRAGSINNIDEASVQAQYCKLKYDFLLDQMFRDAPFNFARRVDSLAISSQVVNGWEYVYQYPSNCLRINRVDLVDSASSPQDYDIKYDVFNSNDIRVIVSNDTSLRIDYRVRVEDPDLYDSQFITAFSHLLASELAIPLVGGDLGRQMRIDELQIYQQFIAAAIAADGNERNIEQVESEFVTIRN